MRLTSAFVAIALTLATGSVARAIKIDDPTASTGAGSNDMACTMQCLEEQRTDCPAGQVGGGSPGCWSACCVPTGPKVPFKKLPEDRTGQDSEDKTGDKSEEEPEDEPEDGPEGENDKSCDGKSGEEDEQQDGQEDDKPVTI